METKQNNAAYGGSFDLPTNGHLWVIRTAAPRYEHLTVFVAKNAGKNPRFSIDERVRVLEAATADIPNVTVVALPEDVFLVEAACQAGASTLIRGIRTSADFQSEYNLAVVNRQIRPEVETVLLVPPPTLSSLSSSTVMGMVGVNGWEKVVESLVPEATFDALEERQAEAFVTRYVRQWLSAPLRHCNGGSFDPVLLDDIIDEVVTAHAEPHRRHHRIAHVANVLRALGDQPAPELLMAMLYHDSVFVVTPEGKTDPMNERGSAEKCEAAARRAGFGDETVSRAKAFIMATAEHLLPSPELSDNVRNLALDADLSVFGDDEQSYRRYARRIRQEHGAVPHDEFVAARLSFLRRLRERPTIGERRSIFRTDFFFSLYEPAAQRNIAAEIALLESGQTM
jgi:pantetheine-phosphate adenylyltransferase